MVLKLGMLYMGTTGFVKIYTDIVISYYVTVIGKPINEVNHAKNGMVIDFKDLKTIVKSEIVDVFDHAMVLNNNSPHSELATVL